MNFTLLSLLLYCVVASCLAMSSTLVGGSTSDSISKTSEIVKDVARATGKSFVQSCGLTIPLALVYRVKELPDVKRWIISGVKDGLDLARMSAACAGGEVISKHIRGKDDRANMWVGSGLSGAFLRLKKGPFEMAKGFGQMFALVYTVDRILPLQSNEEVEPSDRKNNS